MASPYTTQIVNTVILGSLSFHVCYTVPPAKLAVLTDIELFVASTAASQSSFVQIRFVPILYRESPGAGVINYQWTGKLAMNAGDVIYLTNDGNETAIAVTGYVLPL